DHHGAVPLGHGTTFTPVRITETTGLKHRRGRDLLRHVTATGGELEEVLGDRVRELIARSSRIARQSAILVGASQHRRADESLVPQCAWCGKVRVGGHWTLPEELPDFLADLLEDRRTHSSCPDCFAAVEGDADDAQQLGST